MKIKFKQLKSFMNRPGVSKSFGLGRPSRKETRLGVIDPATAATTITTIAQTVNKVMAFVGVGGVSQDRFIARTEEVFKAFKDAGYTGSFIDKYKLRKTQVRDKYNPGNYQKEFDRLHGYIVEKLNYNNPGLGNYWKVIQPSLPLVNLGNISKTSLESFKQLVKMFPPKTYKGQQPFGNHPLQVVAGTTTQASDTNISAALTQAQTTYDVLRDAQGKVIQVRDSITGKVLAPGTPEYDKAVNEASVSKAGVGKVAGILLAAAVVSTAVMYGGKKKNDGSLSGPPKRKSKKKKKKTKRG